MAVGSEARQVADLLSHAARRRPAYVGSEARSIGGGGGGGGPSSPSQVGQHDGRIRRARVFDILSSVGVMFSRGSSCQRVTASLMMPPPPPPDARSGGVTPGAAFTHSNSLVTPTDPTTASCCRPPWHASSHSCRGGALSLRAAEASDECEEARPCCGSPRQGARGRPAKVPQ